MSSEVSKKIDHHEEEEINSLERVMEVTLPKADIDKNLAIKLRDYAKKTRFPGFRPGKVPKQVVEQQYGAQAFSEVIDIVFGKMFSEEIKKKKIAVAGVLDVSIKGSNDSGDTVCLAKYETFPTIVIGDLSKKEIKKPIAQIDDKDVDEVIQGLQNRSAKLKELDRAAKEGDVVKVDTHSKTETGEWDTVKTDHVFRLEQLDQSNSDFKKAVVGMKPGESKEVLLPIDFDLKSVSENEESASKSIELKILLKQVQEVILPEINEDFIKSLGIESGNLDQFRDEVKKTMGSEVKQAQENIIKQDVIDALLAVSPMDAPKTLVDSEVHHMLDRATKDLGDKAASLRKQLLEQPGLIDSATKRVKVGLIFAHIAKENSLKSSDEAVTQYIEERALQYPNPEEVVRWYGQNPDQLAEIEALVLERNVVDWLLSKMTVTEKTVSYIELMKDNKS